MCRRARAWSRPAVHCLVESAQIGLICCILPALISGQSSQSNLLYYYVPLVYLAIKNSRESITYSTLQRNEATMVQKWHVHHIPKGVFRKLALLCCAKQNYNVAPHTLRSHFVSPPTPNPSPLNLPLREPIFIPSQGEVGWVFVR